LSFGHLLPLSLSLDSFFRSKRSGFLFHSFRDSRPCLFFLGFFWFLGRFLVVGRFSCSGNDERSGWFFPGFASLFARGCVCPCGLLLPSCRAFPEFPLSVSVGLPFLCIKVVFSFFLSGGHEAAIWPFPPLGRHRDLSVDPFFFWKNFFSPISFRRVSPRPPPCRPRLSNTDVFPVLRTLSPLFFPPANPSPGFSRFVLSSSGSNPFLLPLSRSNSRTPLSGPLSLPPFF